MPISVFISGVSKDFRDLRIAIGNELRKFRNLSISPIIQDDLSEASDFNGALIDKLISNLRSCRLALCLVGSKAGYPRQQTERKKVLQLVKQRLYASFGRPPNTLGEVWDAWEQKGYGLTYTQLEFFIATVFSEDTRVRLLFQESVPAHVKLYGYDAVQTEFRRFLLQHQPILDWANANNDTDFIRESVQVAVEFAIQMKDSSATISPLVDTREAIIRGLAVLKDLNLRHQLTLPRYHTFYRNCVWPRLCEPVVAWNATSDEHTSSFPNQARLYQALSSPHSTCVVRWGVSSAEVWVFSELLELTRKTTITGITSKDLLCSFTADGCSLLTWNSGEGYSIWTDGKKKLALEAAQSDQPSRTAASLPTIVVVNGCQLAIAIPSGDRWQLFSTDGDKLDMDLENTHPPKPLYVLGRTGRHEIRRPDGTSASINSPEKCFGLDADNGTMFVIVSESKYVLRKYSCIDLLDLFQVKEKIVGPAIIRDSIETRSQQQQHTLLLSTVSNQQVFSHSLPEPIRFNDFRIASNQYITDPSNDVLYKIPFRGRYSWSEDRQYLILLKEQPATGRSSVSPNVTVRLYRFPLPLAAGTAAQMFEKLDSLASASQPLTTLSES